MLAEAGFDVVGCDISPKMIKLAHARVKGHFTISDMLNYKIEGKFAAVFMIFSTLQLSCRFPHGCVQICQCALARWDSSSRADAKRYLRKDVSSYVETKVYVEDYPAPFMGEPLPALMLSAEGQRNSLNSMGVEVVWEQVDAFQPHNEKYELEVQ